MNSDVGKAHLRLILAQLESQRQHLEDRIRIRVVNDVKDYVARAERRVHPISNIAEVDRRWSNPSAHSKWQERALEDAEARFLEQRRMEVTSELRRLDGKMDRIRRMLGLQTLPQVVHDSAPVLLHPSVQAILARASENLPADARAYFPAWTNRHARQLNATMAGAFGPRPQLIELFAGIGGMGSGLERALNAVSVLQAEAVPERRAILAAHFPFALQLEDVHHLLKRPSPCASERLIVAGGFPCRGMSQANVSGQKGFSNPQTGLWYIMLEVIRQWLPRAVIVENVIGLRARGLEEVTGALAKLGYDVLWGTLSASDFGAPHERNRLFAVALRSDLTPLRLEPLPHLPDWLPWDVLELPPNDFQAPMRKARVAALGDAVIPIMAYAVGLTAVRLIGGWRPETTGVRAGELPLHGWAHDGIIEALGTSPFAVPTRCKAQRWVQVDERFESQQTPLDLMLYPPTVGRIRWWDAVSDNVDVEVPGGDVVPFPPEWVRQRLWPTPTANDARNRGGCAQLERHAPGINALCQVDQWLGGDAHPPELLLEHFTGRGAGPSLLEWMMGFERGWTELSGADRSTELR